MDVERVIWRFRRLSKFSGFCMYYGLSISGLYSYS